MASTDTTIGRFSALVEPITDDFGCELVDIESNNGVVRVIIDQPGGLISDVLIEVTKAVSRMVDAEDPICLLYTSPSPRDATLTRMPSSA